MTDLITNLALGFGVALTIGVAASLFTALVVTRLVFDTFIAMGWMKSLPMLHIIRSPNLDFMKLAKPAFILSWAIIIVGIGYGISRGKGMVGYEFLGGDNLTISFKQKVDVDKLREALKPVVGEALITTMIDLYRGSRFAMPLAASANFMTMTPGVCFGPARGKLSR